MTHNPAAGEQLKPCPCGGALLIGELVYNEGTKWQVSCSSCQEGTAQLPTKAEAFEAWNRRATPAQLPDGGVPKETARLCYNRATKKIEKLVHGICVESFDPPENFDEF